MQGWGEWVKSKQIDISKKITVIIGKLYCECCDFQDLFSLNEQVHAQLPWF